MNSFRTFFFFFSNFLFGVGESRINNLIIGHHSQWADQAAKYGIIGVILLYCALRRCFKSSMIFMSLNSKLNLKNHYTIFIWYFAIRGMLGMVIYPHFGIALFVIIPIIMIRLNSEGNEYCLIRRCK